MSYESYCAACTYLGECSDYSGKYWCSKRGNVYASDPKCGSFCEAYSRSNSARANMYDNSKSHQNSGCYITTIVCKLLEYPDNNYYLNTLRFFRDSVMKKDPKYISHLLTYDTVGPRIAKSLEQDLNGKDIAECMFSRYITNAVNAIEERKYSDAINTYVAMTNVLAERYNIDTNIIIPEMDMIDTKCLGHGRLRIRNNII